MSRFDRLYSHFKATKTGKVSRVSTLPDDKRDKSLTDRDYKENMVDDEFQSIDLDADNISGGSRIPQTAWDSGNSEKVSSLSHARVSIKRAPQHFIKDNTFFNSPLAGASDKLDTFETNNIAGGDCESCPAGAKWEWKGPGLWCFYSAYFLGKSAKAIPCLQAAINCPLKETPSSASRN